MESGVRAAVEKAVEGISAVAVVLAEMIADVDLADPVLRTGQAQKLKPPLPVVRAVGIVGLVAEEDRHGS